jgi:DNA-binding NarL/FixJ family response regulator
VQTQPLLLLVTDDQRLSAKAERLSAEYTVSMRIVNSLEANIAVLRNILIPEHSVQYVFLDLDTKEFDAYLLAQELQSAFPTIPIIACSLVFDPTIVQKSKLHGVEMVLQRFKFEELLKKVCEGLR